MSVRGHGRGAHHRSPSLHRRNRRGEITVTALRGQIFSIRPSKPYPLGATVDRDGVSFAVYAKHAHAVFVALFDQPYGEPIALLPLPERTHDIWHGHVRGLQAGQFYALLADGPWDPRHGHRYNPYKFLIDPYAKALVGGFSTLEHLHLAYDPDHADRDLVMDRRSNARVLPKCVVVGPQNFDWQGVRNPGHRMEDLIVYEAHAKGFTAHPSSEVRMPGTYLGFIEKIPYLKALGINAVELLPVQAKYSEDHLTQRGLVNYWGYNTAAFFCLEPDYASNTDPLAPLIEFKTLVRELHRAGIEILLDVVYNHTAEGNELGPTLSFRGLDNAAYYVLEGEKHERRGYRNVTGCGNTLDFGSPVVNRMALDSLRYLVEECHVDGFRFDLATVLGREGSGDFKATAPFFQAISQDPVLSRVKLISEPWDLQTYAVGGFAAEWSEWNGKFRDTVRRFVRGDQGQIMDLGWRLTGSADLYGDDGRGSDASINFVTCHDGFTLWDLVSYNGKHNLANGEENRDGSDHNDSWNCGVEGQTQDETILTLRRQQARNLATLLLLSHGIPMWNAGDEFLRSQSGNNNAYCQDNALGWTNWSGLDQAESPEKAMLDFVSSLIRLRQSLPVFRSRPLPARDGHSPEAVAELHWTGANGLPPVWNDSALRHMACFFDAGQDQPFSNSEPSSKWKRLGLILNGEDRGITFSLPSATAGYTWFVLVQTADKSGKACLGLETAIPLASMSGLPIPARSIVVIAEKAMG